MSSKIKLITSPYIRKDRRGVFVEIINSLSWKNISHGEFKKNSQLGNHYHKKTSLLLYVLKGSCRIKLKSLQTGQPQKIKLVLNQGIIIPPGFFHTVYFQKKTVLILAKSTRYRFANFDTFKP